MASLPRLPKSGQDWTSNDLAAYNISILCQPSSEFFSSHQQLPSSLPLPSTIDPDLLTSPLPPSPSGDFSDETFRTLQYLHLATRAGVNQESAIVDVTREVLRLFQFEEDRGSLLRTGYSIPFMIGGDPEQVARSDMCLVHRNSTILLLIQVGSTVTGRGKDPEAQIVAAAIAAFQFNSHSRSLNNLSTLPSMTIPAITLTGLRPTFYKVPVTQELSDAVSRGEYPEQETIVRKCVVVPRSGRVSEGMEEPEFREEILGCLEGFRRVGKGLWEEFVV